MVRMRVKGFEMLRVLLVNPNTSKEMTKVVDKTAQNLLSEDIQIKSVNPEMGPPSIEGFYDEVFSVPGLLQEVGRHRDWDGFIIACFDDSGLEAARSLVSGPVVGIGEAAFHTACLIGNKFSVITTLARSIPVIENNLLKYGLNRRCSSIRACDVPVLDLEKNIVEVRNKITKEVLKARDDDGADVIVLGCAGMTDFSRALMVEHEIPVVDGIAAAVGLVSSLLKMKLKTSKQNGYICPRSKSYSGIFSQFSPEARD